MKVSTQTQRTQSAQGKSDCEETASSLRLSIEVSGFLVRFYTYAANAKHPVVPAEVGIQFR
jgi:hypothetical protein